LYCIIYADNSDATFYSQVRKSALTYSAYRQKRHCVNI